MWAEYKLIGRAAPHTKEHRPTLPARQQEGRAPSLRSDIFWGPDEGVCWGGGLEGQEEWGGGKGKQGKSGPDSLAELTRRVRGDAAEMQLLKVLDQPGGDSPGSRKSPCWTQQSSSWPPRTCQAQGAPQVPGKPPRAFPSRYKCLRGLGTAGGAVPPLKTEKRTWCDKDSRIWRQCGPWSQIHLRSKLSCAADCS